MEVKGTLIKLESSELSVLDKVEDLQVSLNAGVLFVQVKQLLTQSKTLALNLNVNKIVSFQVATLTTNF